MISPEASIRSHHLVLAIDPGLSGAVARLGCNALAVRRDFKHIRDIAIAVSFMQNGASHAVIEQVGARPGQGVCSMFSFGKSTGAAFGALYTMRPHIEEVSPQKWQNWFRTNFNLPRPEVFDSRALALRLFPGYADLLKRKKDHNTADAILMAYWKICQLPVIPN